MYRYKYDKSYSHKSKRSRRSLGLATFAVVVVMAAAGFVGMDVLRQTQDKHVVVSQTSIAQVQGASVTLVRTPYYQFQLPQKWRESASESKDGHYMYRSYRNDLIEEELTIDVNQKSPVALNNTTTSYVLPVTYNGTDGTFSLAQHVSEPCQNVYPLNSQGVKPDDARVVKQYNVTFPCNPGSGFFQAVVGLVNGTDDLNVKRPNGSAIKFNIVYRNVTVSPRADLLYDIINSFRVL